MRNRKLARRRLTDDQDLVLFSGSMLSAQRYQVDGVWHREDADEVVERAFGGLEEFKAAYEAHREELAEDPRFSQRPGSRCFGYWVAEWGFDPVTADMMPIEQQRYWLEKGGLLSESEQKAIDREKSQQEATT